MSNRWMSLLPRPPLPMDWSEVRAALAGASVLVTGAGGSLGTELVAALAAAGVGRLTLVEVHEPSLFHQYQQLVRLSPALPCRCVLADVRDQRKMARIFDEARPTIVFHLAAYKHVPLAEENVDQVVDLNVFATLGLARLAVQSGVRSFLYPSTDKAVRPPSIYGATKRIVELALRAMAAECPATALRVVRLVNVLGSQGSVIDLFSRQLAAGQPLTLTDPAHTRYWISVEEAIYLLAQVAVAADLPVGPFLLDAGPALTMGEFARRFTALVRPGAEVAIRTIGPRPGERQHEELAYPFETLTPTRYPGILWARDTRPASSSSAWNGSDGRPPGMLPSTASAGGLALWLERLQTLLRQGDDVALRRNLFALVQEEAAWTPR